MTEEIIQDEVAKALERYLVNETSKRGNPFTRPEDLTDMVDLDVAYSPVLLPGIRLPNRVARLSNRKYAIYDVGYPYATMGNHKWDAPEDEIKIHRARFLLQRDIFYQDLVMKARGELLRFRWHTGSYLVNSVNEITSLILPHFVEQGTFIPGQNHILSGHVAKTHVYLDGSIEVASMRIS